eukprot:6192797-Pleurochrysis_carterae.AAC.2
MHKLKPAQLISLYESTSRRRQQPVFTAAQPCGSNSLDANSMLAVSRLLSNCHARMSLRKFQQVNCRRTPHSFTAGLLKWPQLTKRANKKAPPQDSSLTMDTVANKKKGSQTGRVVTSASLICPLRVGQQPLAWPLRLGRSHSRAARTHAAGWPAAMPTTRWSQADASHMRESINAPNNFHIMRTAIRHSMHDTRVS